MARYEHIKIFQIAYVLTIDIHKAVNNFSREHKYTLGDKLKNSAYEMLDLIMRTNALPDSEKLKNFSEIDFRKERVRIYIRIAFDLRAISSGHLKNLNEKIEEVGRQLGGWQKWTAKQVSLVV